MASFSYLTVCSFIWPALIGTANQNITTQRISEAITIIIRFHPIKHFLLFVWWITIFISVILFAKFSASVNTNKEEKISSKPEESDNKSILKPWYNLLFAYNKRHCIPTIITYIIINSITEIVHTRLILPFNFFHDFNIYSFHLTDKTLAILKGLLLFILLLWVFLLFTTLYSRIRERKGIF